MSTLTFPQLELLVSIHTILSTAVGEGSADDVPEGSRVIQISDILRKRLVAELEDKFPIVV